MKALSSSLTATAALLVGALAFAWTADTSSSNGNAAIMQKKCARKQYFERRHGPA